MRASTFSMAKAPSETDTLLSTGIPLYKGPLGCQDFPHSEAWESGNSAIYEDGLLRGLLIGEDDRFVLLLGPVYVLPGMPSLNHMGISIYDSQFSFPPSER